MSQAANGYQTGFTVFPSTVQMSSSGLRKVRFKAMGGVTGIAGVTFAMGAGAQGSIAADGVYTPPAFVTAPANDQVLVTAPDGSQAQAVISLFP